MHRHPLAALTASVVLIEVLALPIRFATLSFTDNGWTFGPQLSGEVSPVSVEMVVWAGLYSLVGLAVWRLWRRYDTQWQTVRTALFLAMVQYGLLIGWAVTATTVSPAYALGVLAVTWWVSIATVAAFTRTDRWAPLLFLPYIIDLSVTLYINYQVALL